MRLVLLSILSLFSCVNLACQLSVQVVDYPPLAYRNGGGHWEGLNKLYVDALLDKVKCEYRFVDTPFARGLKMVSTGDIDMILDVSKTPEREAKFYFIGPKRNEKILLVSRKGAIPIVSSWRDMQSLDAKLIRQRGAFYGNKLEELLKNNQRLNWKVDEMADNNRVIHLVLNKRADAFFVESFHWHHIQNNHPSGSSLHAHPLIINSEPVYYALSKTSVSKQLFYKLDEAFIELKNQQRFKKIEETYIHQLKNTKQDVL